MDNKHIVEYAKIDSVVSSGKPIIIVLFPNYEDRSTGLVTSLFKQNKLEIHAQIDFLLFCLKNRTNNNNLLEDLKDNNIDKIKKIIHDNYYCCAVLLYQGKSNTDNNE